MHPPQNHAGICYRWPAKNKQIALQNRPDPRTILQGDFLIQKLTCSCMLLNQALGSIVMVIFYLVLMPPHLPVQLVHQLVDRRIQVFV